MCPLLELPLRKGFYFVSTIHNDYCKFLGKLHSNYMDLSNNMLPRNVLMDLTRFYILDLTFHHSLQSVSQKLHINNAQVGISASIACPADNPPPSKAQAIINAAKLLAIHNGLGFMLLHLHYCHCCHYF